MRSTDTGRTMGKGNYCSLRRCKGPSSRRGGLEVLGHTGLIQCCLLFTTCWPRLCSPFWPGLKDPGSHRWDKQQRAFDRMRNTLGLMQAWPGVVGIKVTTANNGVGSCRRQSRLA